MAAFNTVTLGGKPVYDTPHCAPINSFFMHSGASRYGRGYFAMIRKDYDAIATGSGGLHTVMLKMDGVPGPGITLPVVIGGCEPISTQISKDPGNNPGDLVRVCVVDARAKKFNPTTREYNMYAQPFGWDDPNSRPQYFPETIDTGAPWTWEDLIDDLGAPELPANPTWIPGNIVFDKMPLARAVDDVLGRLYLVCGWDWTNSEWTANEPGQFSDENTDLLEEAKSKAFLKGGQGELSIGRTPGNFDVWFRGLNLDDLSDPFATPGTFERNYSVTVNVSTNSTTQPLACGEGIALYQGTAWLNSTDLTAIANDVGKRAYAALNVAPEMYEFAGIWPFEPDGAIRGIQWISEPAPAGARTIVLVNNSRDFYPLDELASVFESWSNSLVVGLGTTAVGMDSGPGVRQIIAQGGGGATKLLIYSVRAYFTGGTGCARYNACIGVGSIVGLDPDSNFHGNLPPDANITFPVMPNAIAVDLYEGGSASSGTAVIIPGTIVLGTMQGADDETPSLKVFYFSSAPSGTCFRVALSQVDGLQGDAVTRATWSYDVRTFDGSIQLLAAATVEEERPFGQLKPATQGECYINNFGTIVLMRAVEPPVTAVCVPAAYPGNPAGPAVFGL